MAYSITIAEAAEEDVRQAYLWYEKQQENLGARFEKHFSEAVKSIRNNPLQSQIKYKTIRVFYLEKFPYGIHFRITDQNIVIVAVFHTAMSPERWKRKQD